MENATEYLLSQCHDCIHNKYPLERGLANDIKIKCDWYKDTQFPRGTRYSSKCKHCKKEV